MYKPLPFFIGLRYTRAKRRNHFISFISLMSMLGIALGVMVLITVLSVMNGFDAEIKKRVFSMAPAITVTSINDNISDWQNLENNLKNAPQVTGIAPFVNGQVLLSTSGFVQPALLTGIIPDQEKKISELNDKMVAGDLSSLAEPHFNIVLGEDLANHLGVNLQDKVTVITPQISTSLAGVRPISKRFTVTGIFKAGSGFGFDAALAFINLTDAQKLYQLHDLVSGLHLAVKNVYAVNSVSADLQAHLAPTARITNWTEQFGAFFHAISLEKTMMFFILMLIVAVAVFNLVCSLVMVVNEKEADIAILRTIGATPRTIMAIFIVQGATIGIVGTLLGIISGVALALNVTALVHWIEQLFHVQFLSANVYFVDYLPSQLNWRDVCQISLFAFVLSLLATIYPAWRAAKTEPVEALRYE